MISLYLYVAVSCSFMIGIVYAEQSDTGGRSIIGMIIQVVISPFILPVMMGVIFYEIVENKNDR